MFLRISRWPPKPAKSTMMSARSPGSSTSRSSRPFAAFGSILTGASRYPPSVPICHMGGPIALVTGFARNSS
jgi:hypothetical protein